jgi:thiol-disulfide isomerase/thioredoxin
MRSRAVTVWLCLVCLCLALAAGCAKSPTAGTQRLKAGDVAPTYNLTTLEGDREIDMARVFQNNAATVIIIWSMDCPTCREALVQCDEVFKSYGRKGVDFLGINFDTENMVGVRSFLRAEAVSFTNVWDPRTRAARGYTAKDYTFSAFVVDRDRGIALAQYDHPPDLAAILTQAIDKLLAREAGGKTVK